MAGFDRFTNTNPATSPFEVVVFGDSKSVLEVELNEVQALIYQKFHRLFSLLGNITSPDAIKYSSGNVILNGVFILNGYLFECDNISIPVSDGESVYISVTTGVSTKDSTIRKNGYADGAIISNTIVDTRWGEETTRRKSIEFSVSTTDNSGVEIAKVTNGALVLTGVATSSFSDTKNILLGTLSAGATSLTLHSNYDITDDNIIDVYTDSYGVSPKTMTVSGKDVTMTFKAQSSNIRVKVVIQ